LNLSIDFYSLIADLKVCVIIPTYNNHKTLKRVIDGVLIYTDQIIIVNDGSTDKTVNILEEYPNLDQINFNKNKGKGSALRAGFKRAYEQDYEYAITIDSDGQHFPDDIPAFISEIKKYKNVLLIGSRNMKHESVPKNSSFGNKFSNFWFWIETGIKLSDTQSGFRLYPLNKLSKINFYTTKFEFEIESIVKIAWRGVDVKNIPIKVLYDLEERVSHFRPITDFIRISILNTWLVFVAFIYIKPRDFFLRIKRKGIKRFINENILYSPDSPTKKAFSVALGIFIGIAPFWGLQTVIVLALAVLLKLNKLISFTFSNISIPPMIPFIIYGSLRMGNWILNGKNNIEYDNISSDFNILLSLEEYIIGSFVLAFLSSIVFGVIGFVIFKLIGRSSG
jgi:glycosyltransferase involved in cell wall biosynthesis